MSWVISIAKLFCQDVFKEARKSNKIQVVGISISHYCELACWSLEAAKIKFEEQAYMPGQHVLPAMVVRIGGEKKHYATTSKMTSVKSSATPSDTEPLLNKSKDKKGRPNPASVPIAVLPDGSVLLDSWDIAAYSGLAPIDDELKSWLDDDLGTLSRQMAYAFILKPSNRNIFDQLFTEGSHWLWRFVYSLAGNYVHDSVVKKMKPFDTAANKLCRDRLDRVVEQIGERIKNKKTPYLGGESIGVADIAVASLMAPLVSPPQYIHGRFTRIFDKLALQDREVNENVQYWRSTVVGQYAMDIYAQHRGK